MTKYFAEWWTIMARPIYFYTILKEENWQAKPLSFLMKTAWLLAFLAALVVFIIQFVPIGSTLVAGISGYKFIIILPVLITLAAIFFLITFLLIGGLFVSGLFVAFGLVALVLHYSNQQLGGQGKLERMLQGAFYSSAAVLPFGLIFLLMILTKYGGLEFRMFGVGFNFLFFLVGLYLYGLWAIAGRKNYHLSKPRAFFGAIGPVLVLLIFVLGFDKIIFPKLKSWIT